MEALVPRNKEISINYGCTREYKILAIDIFSYDTVAEIIVDDYGLEPHTLEECRQWHDWPKWKDVIQVELDSLAKREVFGPKVLTPNNVNPVIYKWVFARKQNEKNEIVRYKARLVAHIFLQTPGIDYEETYSPEMDAIAFQFLISQAILEILNMHLMDMVMADLCRMLDTNIYMKVPKGLKLPEAKPRNMYCIKLKRSLYGLKQ